MLLPKETAGNSDPPLNVAVSAEPLGIVPELQLVARFQLPLLADVFHVPLPAKAKPPGSSRPSATERTTYRRMDGWWVIVRLLIGVKPQAAVTAVPDRPSFR